MPELGLLSKMSKHGVKFEWRKQSSGFTLPRVFDVSTPNLYFFSKISSHFPLTSNF